MKRLTCLCLIGLYFVAAADCATAITIDMVPVGNPGNAPDTRYDATGFGSVANDYQIGKYEVTAGQYTEFLNAVADDDPNGLYNAQMGDPSGDEGSASFGANIQRTGSSPTYSYSVAADWADRPVDYVSFWDAARFANWLDNGQPTGAQGPGTTEDGAYHDVDNQTLFGRSAGARFFIPTEDEWYKAAYHDQTAGLAASYFDYPTGTNAEPGNDFNETTNPGNNAHYLGFTVSPYYRTVAGEFELSDSPYGTFDQGGNVWEWNETRVSGSSRGLRGGSAGGYSDSLLASSRGYGDPAYEIFDIGFRVASIPELPGDFNLDGTVDAADYVVWRKAGGSPDDYNTWQTNFARAFFPGSGMSAPGSAGGSSAESRSSAIAEPSTLALAAALFGLVASIKRRAAECVARSPTLPRRGPIPSPAPLPPLADSKA